VRRLEQVVDDQGLQDEESGETGEADASTRISRTASVRIIAALLPRTSGTVSK